MSTGEMFKNVLVLKAMLIFVALTIFSFGNMTVYAIVGILLALVGCFLAFRQGAAMGHESCSVTASLERIAKTDAKRDPRMEKQAYSVSNAVKSIFAGGIISYTINVVYIILMLLDVDPNVLVISRLASFLMITPYWPFVSMFHPTFNVLTWDIVAVLMLSPFLLPACQFAGYVQGPKLWANTEKAMAEGKRRAKARSRIGKKKERKVRGPEI